MPLLKRKKTNPIAKNRALCDFLLCLYSKEYKSIPFKENIYAFTRKTSYLRLDKSS